MTAICVCNKKLRLFLIFRVITVSVAKSMTSHLKEYFQDPLQVIERAMRIVAFQEKHCSILMKFHGKRVK